MGHCSNRAHPVLGGVYAVRVGGQYRTFIYTKKVFDKGTKRLYYKGAIRKSNQAKGENKDED